jgi:hypothetical protein
MRFCVYSDRGHQTPANSSSAIVDDGVICSVSFGQRLGQRCHGELLLFTEAERTARRTYRTREIRGHHSTLGYLSPMELEMKSHKVGPPNQPPATSQLTSSWAKGAVGGWHSGQWGDGRSGGLRALFRSKATTKPGNRSFHKDKYSVRGCAGEKKAADYRSYVIR